MLHEARGISSFIEDIFDVLGSTIKDLQHLSIAIGVWNIAPFGLFFIRTAIILFVGFGFSLLNRILEKSILSISKTQLRNHYSD